MTTRSIQEGASVKKFCAVRYISFGLINQLRDLNKIDATLLDLQSQLQLNPESLPHFSFQGGLLLFRNRILVPADTKLRTGRISLL